MFVKNNQGTKFLVYVFLISLLIPRFGAAAHAEGISQNQVVFQSDFEDGKGQWYGRWGPTVEAVTETAHGGMYSLKTTGRDDSWKGPAQNITDFLKRGQSYHITGWVKAIGSDAKVSMSILRQFDNGKQDFHNLAYEVGIKTSEWTKLEGDFTFASGMAADSFDLYFESPNATLAFYIDDIKIEKKEVEAPTEWVTNFDDGTLQGWQPRIGSEVLTAVKESTHDNSAYAMKVTGRTDSYFGPALDVTAMLQPGATYTFTAWLRLADGSPSSNVQMSMQTKVAGEASYDPFSFEKVTSGAWVQIKGKYTARPEIEQYIVYFESPNKTLSFYIDDFKLSKNPDLGPIVLQDNIGTLKAAYADDFLIGTAFSGHELEGVSGEFIKKHFNSITPGNIMKMDNIQPREGEFHWTDQDAALQFAKDNGIKLRGHTLVWHQQTPDWVFKDAEGNAMNPEETDPIKRASNKALVLARMKTHIETVLRRYQGKIYAWDVVNEVIDPGQPNGMRQSLWYRICGEEFIEKAFEYAHAEDPSAKLYINDYETEVPQKRAFLKALVQRLLHKGIPVDGVGHQMHINLEHTSVQQMELAIETFADLGLDNQITEMDMDIFSNDSQRLSEFSNELALKQAYKYKAIFDMLRAHKDHISAVTFWGKDDGSSWLRSFPVYRDNWPLLFDERMQAKYAYWAVVDPTKLPPLIRNQAAAKGTPAIDGESELRWDAMDWTPLRSDAIQGEFKTLWDEGHLYVLAEVDDPIANDKDAVDIFLDGNNGKTLSYEQDDVHISLNRKGDASGAKYVVKERPGGYRIEASIPFPSLDATHPPIGFDVRMQDADGLKPAVSWNDWQNGQDTDTSRFGTLSFGPAYQTASSVRGTPIIDGEEDASWDNAEQLSTDSWVEGSSGAKAKVKTMWDEGHLYVLAKVTDPVLSKRSSLTYMQDSVELFVSQNNTRTNYYGEGDGQYRINFDNEASFSNGLSPSNMVSRTKLVPGGYVIEASIVMDKVDMKAGSIIGFDVQVNDDGLGDGNRSSVATWSDDSGKSYMDTTKYGYLQLAAGPGTPSGPYYGGSGISQANGNGNVSNGRITVNGAVDANGASIAHVDAVDVKAALKTLQDKKLAISVSPVSPAANSVKVVLPVQDILQAGSDVKDISVDIGDVTITFSPNASAGILLAGSQEAVLSIARVDVNVLPAGLRRQIQGHPVYDLSLIVDGKEVHVFPSDRSLAVTMNYTLQPGENPNEIVIYFIDSDGKPEVVKNAKYDQQTGTVTFRPKHFSRYAIVNAHVSFTDLHNSAWAQPMIEYLAARSIVKASGEARFHPEQVVTRSELVEMLLEALELKRGEDISSFSDVKEGVWYYAAVASAQKLGIVKGRADGTFGGNERITREDLAVIVQRAAAAAGLAMPVSVGKTDFKDKNEISGYAVDAAAAMQQAGWITGFADGSFRPKDAATRAQAAAIVCKLILS